MVGIREIAVRLRKRPAPPGPLPADVCRAPFASMYLDQHGSVRACCQNVDHPLGNVTQNSLREIWESSHAQELRQAMLDHDLDRGCAFCKWQVAEGNDALVFARTFDHLRADSTSPPWPRQLELSMSNACNLQCVMCNGDWSSSIRANREGRPPLPQVYGEQFFDDLRPFLEHVEVVKILGGEPFLGKESLRVMEMLVEMGSTAAVHVTTNGTQWSPRVQRILERLPMVIVVSLDGVDEESYGSIRVGADLATVLENLDRFRQYASEHGTQVNLAHCLMTSNWRGFPDFLRFAEDRGLRAYVNTVTYPNTLSLFHLPPSRLREIVSEYEAVDVELNRELTLNLSLWKDQLHRLQHRLEALNEGEGVDYYLGVMGFPLMAPGLVGGPAAARAAAAAVGGPPPTLVRVDLDHRIVGVIEGPPEVLDVPIDALAGRDLESLLGALGKRHGAASVSAPTAEHLDVRHWRLVFPHESTPPVSVFIAPIRDAEGVVVEFEAHMAIEVLEEATARPTVRHEELLGLFRAEHPDSHLIEIGPDGRVRSVASDGSPLGAALQDAVGIVAEELVGTLSVLFGDLVDLADEDLQADGAHRYVVRFRNGTGDESSIDALVLPSPTSSFGAAGSRVVLAQGR